MRRNKIKPATVGGVLLLFSLLISACTEAVGGRVLNDNETQTSTAEPQLSKDPSYYTEPFRPQYHLSPPTGNMSDPNGMVYFEGEYHQFYQNSGQWGHAVSSDLLHWEHLPVALARDSLGEIWSGSAVVDWKDTSGFFGGKPGLVAVFTHFRSGKQSQSIAYSTDKGRTWTKFEGNPVIPNPGLKDFRDPKVIWHEPTRSWVMVVSADQKIQFYTSNNLKEWKFSSEFGIGHGSHTAVWECPDLFELPVEGTGTKKWVLTVSIGNNAVTKGSTAQYFIGSFDGKTFKNDNSPSLTLWTDYGKDFYAAISYSDIPPKDGRRIWTGWMSNWRYPFNMPTGVWKGNLSIPRELKLRDLPGMGLRLVQNPVKELEKLRGKAVTVPKQELLPNRNPLDGIKGTSYELETEFTLSEAAKLGLKLRMGSGQETIIGYDAAAAMLTLDRTRSGISTFEGGFAEVMQAPLKTKGKRIKLRMFVDDSTLEVFANDGEAVLSSILFPSPLSNGMELYISEGTAILEKAHYYPMRTVWRNEDPDATIPLRIQVSRNSLDVPVGKTEYVSAAVIPLTSPQEVRWESSDPNVAAAQASGSSAAAITGMKAGQAEVRAIARNGQVMATMNVFVYEERNKE